MHPGMVPVGIPVLGEQPWWLAGVGWRVRNFDRRIDGLEPKWPVVVSVVLRLSVSLVSPRPNRTTLDELLRSRNLMASRFIVR